MVIAQVGMDICADLVWILVQVEYGYLRRFGMDICAGLVWIFAWVWYGEACLARAAGAISNS